MTEEKKAALIKWVREGKPRTQELYIPLFVDDDLRSILENLNTGIRTSLNDFYKEAEKWVESDWFAWDELKVFKEHCDTIHPKGNDCGKENCFSEIEMNLYKKYVQKVMNRIEEYSKNEE